MNARVFLLVLVCSVFMSVWNSDQRAMNAALAKKQRVLSPESVAMTPPSHGHGETSQIPMPHFSSSGSVNVSTETTVTATEAAEPTTVVAFFSQAVPTITLPVLFVVEVGHPALMSNSTASMETAETLTDISDVVDEVIVTELVDVQTDFRFSWESPEALTLSTKVVTSQELSSEEVASEEMTSAQVASTIGDGSIADSFAPTPEELAIVVEPPQTVPTETLTPTVETTVAGDEAASLIPQTSVRAMLPLESTGPIIPLPKNLASGTWTVMNQSGDAFKVTIERTSTVATASQETLEPNFCLRTTSDGDRWCFIRSFADHAAEETTTSPRQATTEFFSPIRR